MANGIRTDDPRGFYKRRSSKFREGSRVRQTPEEGRGTYRPKCCGNNKKDEDNNPKILNDKKQISGNLFKHWYHKPVIPKWFGAMFHFGNSKILMLPVISNSYIFKILLQFTWRRPLTWSLDKPHRWGMWPTLGTTAKNLVLIQWT